MRLLPIKCTRNFFNQYYWSKCRASSAARCFSTNPLINQNVQGKVERVINGSNERSWQNQPTVIMSFSETTNASATYPKEFPRTSVLMELKDQIGIFLTNITQKD